MKIDINEIVKNTAHRGKKYFVCDYRRPDLGKKAARNLAPTEVIVLSDEDFTENDLKVPTVYYSCVALAKLNKKGEPKYTSLVPPYDNTGYRYRTGVGINVFDSEEECINFYNQQVQDVVDVLEGELLVAQTRIQFQIDETNNLKVQKRG